MINYAVETIPVNYFFTEPVFIDSGFVFTSPEMPITKELLDILKNWQVTSVLSEGVPQENYKTVKPAIKKDDLSALNDTEKLKSAESFFAGFQKFTAEIFARAAMKNRITFDMVAEKIKDVCDEVKENRRFLLQIQHNVGPVGDENFLAAHAAKSTILSIIIGNYLKLPPYRLIELGVAALLHEIGMVRLPSSVYLNKGELSDRNREAILLHPTLGFEILKAFDFPMTVSAAAYEHHERENGTGYPRSLSGERISLYGKIIAVACSYEAITSKRPHKEAREGYVGITDLLRNEGKQYDDAVVRALVFSLSIYPIGQFVMLSNKKKAQVVDVNPADPRYPIVQLLDEQTPDGKNKILETSATGVKIESPIEKEKIAEE